MEEEAEVGVSPEEDDISISLRGGAVDPSDDLKVKGETDTDFGFLQPQENEKSDAIFDEFSASPGVIAARCSSGLGGKNLGKVSHL